MIGEWMYRYGYAIIISVCLLVLIGICIYIMIKKRTGKRDYQKILEEKRAKKSMEEENT